MFGAKTGSLLSVFAVAPLAGAGIEINMLLEFLDRLTVAPLVGARVEISPRCCSP